MAHQRFSPLAVAILATILAGAAGTELGAQAQGASVRVSLVPGAAYTHKVRFGLVSMKLTPQIAMWIETAEGRFVDTIFVTQKAGNGRWKAAGKSRRPESLPVWSHARGIAAADGLYMPTRASELPDAVSGATETGAFAKDWRLPAGLAPGSYRIRVELNSSYDWNEAFPDKLPKDDPRYSEVNGQPSIVWETALALGGGAAKAALAPSGSGSLRGEDGAMKPGLEGLTSARELAESIVAEYRP